jgi:hypothetical protein
MKHQPLNIDKYTNDLERLAIDPCSSFLNGGATSLFESIDVTSAEAASNTLKNLKSGRISNPFLPVGPMPNPVEVASGLTTLVIEDVTEYATAYVAEKVGQLLTPPALNEITSLATSYMSKYLMSGEDIMKELTTTLESTMSKIETLDINKSINSLMNTVNEHVGKITGEVGEFVNDKLPDWMDGIGTYIQQGPKYVKDKVCWVDEQCCYQIEKVVGKGTDFLFDKKQKMINSIAEGAAKVMADVVNKKLKKEQKKLLDKTKKAIAKATVVARAAASAALLGLKAKLGL